MSNLTKRDLVQRISNETGLIQQDVLNIIQRLVNHLSQSIVNGQPVEIRNFGVFLIKFRKARVGRNPRRPEVDVPIPARGVVKFRPGKQLKKRVSKLSDTIAQSV